MRGLVPRPRPTGPKWSHTLDDPKIHVRIGNSEIPRPMIVPPSLRRWSQIFRPFNLGICPHARPHHHTGRPRSDACDTHGQQYLASIHGLDRHESRLGPAASAGPPKTQVKQNSYIFSFFFFLFLSSFFSLESSIVHSPWENSSRYHGKAQGIPGFNMETRFRKCMPSRSNILHPV